LRASAIRNDSRGCGSGLCTLSKHSPHPGPSSQFPPDTSRSFQFMVTGYQWQPKITEVSLLCIRGIDRSCYSLQARPYVAASIFRSTTNAWSDPRCACLPEPLFPNHRPSMTLFQSEEHAVRRAKVEPKSFRLYTHAPPTPRPVGATLRTSGPHATRDASTNETLFVSIWDVTVCHLQTTFCVHPYMTLRTETAQDIRS
jgi:hypothetical protein